MNNDELSGNSTDKEFNRWADSLEKMSDIEVSHAIYDRILTNSDLSSEDKKLLKDSYEYASKLISQNKPLEANLLKIYLSEVKGYDIYKVNIVNVIVLLAFCGIIFE